MNITELSIKRPVTTNMIFILVILMGVISWIKLPQELFPPLVFPQISIVTTYPNAAPEEIETLITRPIEEIVGTVKNLKRISSNSKEGISLVSIEFGWNTNMDMAAINVREKIDLIKEKLPLEAQEPVVMKYNPFELPVMMVSITRNEKKISANELLQITRRIIKDRIEKINGVASVSISGGQEKQILIEVDQNRLQANQLSILDVVEAIKNTNLNYPAGTAKEKVYEYLIRTIGEYRTVKEIPSTIVNVAIDDEQARQKKEQGSESDHHQKPTYKRRMVTLANIAQVLETVKDRTSYSRYNEQENITLSILKQSEANTIRTAQKVRQAIQELASVVKTYGINLHIVYDQSAFIKNSIQGLMNDAILGGILSFIIIYLFLLNLRSSLIICVSIPVSVMVSFFLMYIFDISINMMSLGGLALGVGMVVDNANVVVEDIFRHSHTMPYKEASVAGTREVNNAIFASTLTTICVFFPLLWVIGIAGQVFRQLSWTVIFSISASYIVAVTYVPRLMSTIRKREDTSQEKDLIGVLKNNYFFFVCMSRITNMRVRIKKSFIGRVYQQTVGVEKQLVQICWEAYPRGIEWFLDNRMKGFTITIILFVVSLFLLAAKNREFLPKIDQHQFIVKITMPVGTRVEITNTISQRIEEKIKTLPEIKSFTTTIGSEKREAEAVETLGSHQGQIVVELKKSKKEFTSAQLKRIKKPHSTYEVIRQLKYQLNTVDLMKARVECIQQDSIFTSMVEAQAPITIKVQGHNIDILKKLTDEITGKLNRIAGIIDVRNNMPLPSPETKVIPDKDRAATYNLSVSDIARTALVAIKGFVASKFKEEGNEVDMVVRLREADRNDIQKLKILTIHSPYDYNLPINEVAVIQSGKGPSEIIRQDRQRTVLVTAQIQKRSLKDITRDVESMVASANNVSGFTISVSGEAERIKESFTSLIWVLIASIILVYMVMAAQFESLWQPFIIMFTIPLSLIGVALGLLISGHTINAISMLGVVILGGIVVNNGIVLVDYVNQLKTTGRDLREILIEAGKIRLRPILMTALTTIVGLLPLSLGIGEGAELRAPMAVTVMVGLTVSTLLTLFVIPAIYFSFDTMLNRNKKERVQ